MVGGAEGRLPSVTAPLSAAYWRPTTDPLTTDALTAGPPVYWSTYWVK